MRVPFINKAAPFKILSLISHAGKKMHRCNLAIEMPFYTAVLQDAIVLLPSVSLVTATKQFTKVSLHYGRDRGTFKKKKMNEQKRRPIKSV